jgi:hypothetical protein
MKNSEIGDVARREAVPDGKRTQRAKKKSGPIRAWRRNPGRAATAAENVSVRKMTVSCVVFCDPGSVETGT